ncbi:MAG: U32 family peptidase [Clostridia bacterium]|nr:U32 family peptidase [Clostridia bacterium]
MELLAPAGSAEALTAAVQSGADAVYIGGSKFSARASAQNFDADQMREWVNYCHLRNVKVHVAANTLVKEKETDKYLKYIGELNDIGVDAVIIQDIGMAKAVHMKYPNLELHASTQITCASSDTALYLENIGFSRIVLARELDISAIEKISKNITAETEVFIHGAICMCYSGQCLMSSMIGGRSGNRGYCAQPCRLPYKLQQNGKNMKTGYLLSPKDMCLANHLEELEKAGVTSLKIEGRLKRPEYVSAVTGVYRKLLDSKSKPTDEDSKQLLDAFNRSGFTDGYFTKKTGKEMMSYHNPSNISENRFSEEAKQRCIKDIELKTIPIDIYAELKKDEFLVVKISDGCRSVTVLSEKKAEEARVKPITKERLVEQLCKLGATPYAIRNIDAAVDENVIIPVGEINSVRRKACEKLSEERIKREKNIISNYRFDIEDKPVNEMSFTVNVRTKEQAKACFDEGIKTVYAPAEVILNSNINADWIQVCPPVDREGKTRCRKVSDKIQISSWGQMTIDKNSEFYGEFRLNITNSYSLENMKNFKCVTLSPELTLKEIKAMKKPVNCEVIVYGRIPLMVYENCPKKAAGYCDKGKSKAFLKDRMNEDFPLICREGCYCELLNSKPLFMADKLNDLRNIGIRYMRLDFTVEDYDETRKIIKEYKDAFYNGIVKQRKENTFTRGHFYKGIE